MIRPLGRCVRRIFDKTTAHTHTETPGLPYARLLRGFAYFSWWVGSVIVFFNRADSASQPVLTLNLPVSETSIAERMVEIGYETAFFGKWHVSQHYGGKYLGWHPDYGPLQQGFRNAAESIGVNDFAVSQTRPQSAIRKGNWKVLHFAEEDRVELYDLAADVSENQDVSETFPDEANRLKQDLINRLRSVNARFATTR